ncbi:DUF927 domain-containing protein [Cereibacter changlensis]|nr:DUF927 domain-containing protein [Cereibacter changlensis]
MKHTATHPSEFRGRANAAPEVGTAPGERVRDGQGLDVEAFLHRVAGALSEGYQLDANSRAIYTDQGEPICGPIQVSCLARRPDQSGWSAEVRILDRDDCPHVLFVEMAEIHGSGAALYNRLISLGLQCFSGKTGIMSLLKSWRHAPRAWRSDEAGWFDLPDAPPAFLRANGVLIAPASDAPLVVHARPDPKTCRKAGSLYGWRNEVACLAFGNPSMIFAICCALAGPILRLSGFRFAGFNFHGNSTVGKSLLLELALSCSDHPNGVRPWTSVAQEKPGAVPKSTEGLLVLDALPRDPGKPLLDRLQSMADDLRQDSARGLADLQLGDPSQIILSTSELATETVLQRKRRSLPEALSTRLADIPAGSWRHGLVEDLNGHSDAGEFARALSAAMTRHHGQLFPAFLQILVNRYDAIAKEIRKRHHAETERLLSRLAPRPGENMAAVRRMIERFAFVAAAGEEASALELLPWPRGTAAQAVTEVVTIWSRAPRHAPEQRPDLVTAFAAWLDQRQDRLVDFMPADLILTEQDPATDGRIGWKDKRFYYLLPHILEQELGSCRDTITMLSARGILKPGGEQRLLQCKMPASLLIRRPRLYRIDQGALQEAGRR